MLMFKTFINFILLKVIMMKFTIISSAAVFKNLLYVFPLLKERKSKNK